MNEALSEFIKLSHYCGMRLDLIQASGGNTSVKYNDSKMYIKSSGVTLSEVSKDYGFSVVNYNIVAKYLNDLCDYNHGKSVDDVLHTSLISGMRPSIETLLHAITKRVTMHVHSISVNILAASCDYENIVKKLFPSALIVGYGTPGIGLAREYIGAFKKAGVSVSPDIIFLKNHGIVITGDSYEDVKELSEEVSMRIERYLGISFDSYRRATNIWEVISKITELKNKIVYKVENKEIIDFYESRNGKLWEYRFCPDCIVFLGKKNLDIASGMSEELIINHIKDNGIPVIITDEKDIYILADSMKRAHEIEEVLEFSEGVFKNLKNLECLSVLPDNEQNNLLNLDSEKYRQSIK